MKNVDYVAKLLAIAQNDENTEPVFVRISQMMLQKLPVLGTLQNRQLAKLCYVDASTISRFIKYLGFQNYGEFKDYFSEYSEEKNINYYFALDDVKHSSDLVDSVTKALQATYQGLDFDILKKVIALIEQYDEILLCGDRYSQLVAEDLQLKLLSLGHYAKTYKDVQLQNEHLRKHQGLMIMFSATVNLAQIPIAIAKENGWCIVIISRNIEAQNMADACLLYDQQYQSTWTKHSVNDRFCMQLVVDQLIYLLAHKKLHNMQ